MSQDGFVGIRAVTGNVRVSQPIEQVTVAGFDSIEPRLLDWKAKSSMVEANQGANAEEIHAVGVESCAGGAGLQGHSLRSSVEVEDRAGFAAWANGMDVLAGMQTVLQGRRQEPPGSRPAAVQTGKVWPH